MKKIFVAPKAEMVTLCVKDILTLSTNEKGKSMELDLGDLFVD